MRVAAHTAPEESPPRSGSAPRRRLRAGAAAMLAGLAGLAGVLWGAGGADAADALNLYSHRQPFLIEPFLDAFTAETGVEVNVVYASKGLAQRLQAEARNSPADVVLTVDIGRLAIYADKDLLAPVESAVLTAAVPAHLRDPDGRWFALSKRARVIAVSKERVPQRRDRALRGSGGPAMGGADLHAARQPCLQPRADGIDDRGPRRRGAPRHGPPASSPTSPAAPRATTGPRSRRSTRVSAMSPSSTATITASSPRPRSRSSGHGPTPSSWSSPTRTGAARTSTSRAAASPSTRRTRRPPWCSSSS